MSSRFGALVRAVAMNTLMTATIRSPRVSLTARTIEPPDVVAVPTRHGVVRCLITRPPVKAPLAARGALPPVTINIHGGGFVVGNPRQDDHLVRGIAGEVGSVVVNVDYSTSPKARFPQALEECFDVLKWVARNGTARVWDSKRIALSGGSAGANLALGLLTLSAREGGPAVRTAALLVPAVDLTIPPELHDSPIAKPFVDAGMRTVVDVSYFSKDADRADPLASPSYLVDEELAALPPLLVVTAEYDTFRPFIERFAERVRSVGVPVDEKMVAGVDHDFYFSRTTAAPVLTDLMTALTEHLLARLAAESRPDTPDKRPTWFNGRMAQRWIATEFGGLDAFELAEFEVPAPAAGEVTVDIRAAGMNPADYKHVAAGTDRDLLPIAVGYEVAGVITALGPDTEIASGGGAVGDEVLAFRVRGGYASAITVPARDVFAKPPALGFPEAANLLLAGATAAEMLHVTGATEGDTVLVHGASGAVGVSVLQQAALLGVRVIGTASPGSFDRVREFGGEPVEYGEGLADRVRELAPEGVAAALDTVGTDEAVDVSLALVEDRDRIVTIAAFGRAEDAGIRAIAGAMPESARYRDSIRAHLIELAADGRLVVPIARTFPLGDARQALELLQGQHPGGKLALKP